MVRQLRALVVVMAVAAAGQAAARTGSPATYKVKRGDTLSAIARRHNTTVDALARANALANPDRIYAGQLLSLQAPKGGATAAPAKVGATAPAAAGPAPLAAPLTNEVVVLGGNGTSTYKVVSGDNLSDLAKRYGTSIGELRRLNHLKPDRVLRIGASLAVPGSSWTCPVAGKHVFGDGWNAAREGGRRHMGVDVFAVRGTPVVAPVAGRLEYRSGAIGGLAFYLFGVDGVTYYGAHLDTQTAPVGNLAAGAQIGTVGNTGNARGGATHLHFEIHPAGHAVNPFPTLSRWC
jgi:LysM repeat protein